MTERRAAWPAELAAILPERLIFLDETGAKTNLTPTHGRAFKGHRVPGSAPACRYRNTTLISAIGPDRIAGSLVVEGACDTAAFVTYLERILLPELSAGDVIVLDNLNVHRALKTALRRGRGTCAPRRACGCCFCHRTVPN